MATEINQLPTIEFTYQSYADTSLIGSIEAPQTASAFSPSSYIELFVYDNNKNIIETNYNFTDYTFLNQSQLISGSAVINEILIDPEKTLMDLGLDQGEYNPYYNFLNNKVGSNTQNLFISEISSDRTELRLDSISFGIQDMVDQSLGFIQERNNSPYFIDFYLNFGENKLVIANNIVLDNQNPDTPTILVKLYQALPQEFTINSLLWIVTPFNSPTAYQVIFEDTIITVTDTANINGPNFNLNIKDQVNNSSQNLSYSDLTSTPLTSSFNQLNSLLEEREIDINLDYTNFTEFTHFSSVKTRLENFYYKVSLLEDYSASISSIITDITGSSSSSLSVLNSITLYESKISDIITNFDGYDYYLYYSSGSYSWPKTTSEPPYLLATTGSNAVLTWFGSDIIGDPNYGGIILSASQYDELNPNSLYYSIPEYLRNDPSNDQYTLFIDMVGQFYDNIWIYYKDVTQKYNADNRLEYGISKDIVADAIRDFGLKLYQNNFSNEDLYTAFLGLTPEGGLFPFPNITGSLPTPSGYEYVDTLISASNDYMPLDDVNKSLYKRIYHNLPYLLKSKGTLPGLRALITSYGIPDTILRINEYGGKDKANTNDWDYWQNEFNYAFYTTGSNHISTSWPVNADWNSLNNVPRTVEFRFKTEGLPTSNIPYSQSLWHVEELGTIGPSIILKYTGSGYSSGSYPGSIIDPYYQYATLEFCSDYISSPGLTASIYFPFFDGGWWSVMVTRENTQDFTLHAGNKIYEGGDNGTLLGFYTASYILSDDVQWANSDTSFFAKPQSIAGNTYNSFSGSLQEIRYYNEVISPDIFKDYIMNPSSIEGDSINSSPNELMFRASLGGELYTESISIHPKVTGSWATTSSFPTPNLNSFNFFTTPTFVPNTEYFFYDQPAVGIKNAISDKIRLENNVMPSGNTLSPFRSLAQQLAISQSYTANTNLLEVAFSPQDEINEDIMDQIGYFNIGEYIGDPRLRSSSAESYPLLDTLRNEYFQKYTKNYDLVDYIRLIKFFDNSLFKMIKDFVPVRTSFASGIVIKQHLLERNKYPQPQVNNHSTIAYYPSGSSTNPSNNQPLTFQNIIISGTVAPQWNDFQPGTIENFSGGTGGVFEIFNGVNSSPYGPNGIGPENIFNLTQSWYESTPTISGSVLILRNTQDEFYNGEFSGSNIIVTTQSLSQAYPLQNESFLYKHVHYNITNLEIGNDTFNGNYINSLTAPFPGEILFLNVKETPPIIHPILGQKYLKIAKTDCSGSDNTIALGQLNTIYIENVFSLSSGFTKYDVIVLNEFSLYYLYEVLNSTALITSNPSFPNQLFNYKVSSSITVPYNFNIGVNKTIINWNTTLPGTNLPHYGTPYFNTSSGILTFENTPNTPLFLTASFSITSNDPSPTIITSGSQLILNRNGVETALQSFPLNTGGTNTYTFSSSLSPIQNDQYYFIVKRDGSPISYQLTVNSAQLLLTQSRAVSSSNCDAVIFEPYIITPNYYNSDYNSLINNVLDNRLSSIYQDVDYSTGIFSPTNFLFLISGSAFKAAVQDSNYTTKRHIIPRYEGSKSTSQYLNVWTEGDSGTYGKVPTVESLKTMVAYCDSISGWPPERMNASAIHVLYLIKQDGTVIIPNTSENSLTEIQGTFMSGEKLLINSKTIGSGEIVPSRNIIRGGTRIEPILYTQSGSTNTSPSASWINTINFTNLFNTGIPTITTDVRAQYNYINNSTLTNNAPTTVPFNIVVSGQIQPTLSRYTVTQNVIDETISLQIKTTTIIKLINNNSGGPYNFLVQLLKYSPLTSTTTILNFNNNVTIFNIGSITLSANLNSTMLSAGDEIYVNVVSPNVSPSHLPIELSNSDGSPNQSEFIVNQSPIPITPVSVGPSPNSLWGWPNPTLYPNVITCSNPTLNEAFNNFNIKQLDVTGSGFNPVTLPWSIEYGDEFRFEGREDLLYQVGKIFSPTESGSGRLSQTGSIEVHFNYNLPVSASSSVFNLDHFLIRRYVDDASLILMEGFKPTNANGPYIVRPEYVVPELNKSVDQFILDLTQKGLIT
jgi:hypothetical protein